MTHISIERKNKVLHIPEATVGDLITMMDQKFEDERVTLLTDLDEVNASTSDKLVALTALRETKGLTTALMRSAFSLSGAIAILKHIADPKDIDQILDAPPDDIVWLALRVLGFDSSDDEAEESAEGKASPIPVETSTQT